MTIKHLFIAAVAAVTFASTVQAQVKIGSNPAALSANSVLDVEGTSGSHTVVMQNGNVGIGTNTPASALNIVRDIPTYAQASQILINGTNQNYQLSLGFNTTAVKGYIQAAESGVSWRDLILQPNGAFVGIGALTPTNLLHVTATADPLRLEGVQGGIGTEEALLIDANGVVKKQSSAVSIPTVKVSAGISANVSGTSYGALQKVALNTTYLNDGNFSVATSSYTVPTTGVYMIAGTVSANYSTSNATVSMSGNIVVNGQPIQISQVTGTAFPSTGSFVMAGSLTIRLNAGTVLYLGTISCGPNAGTCPQTYTITPSYTNLTVTKML